MLAGSATCAGRLVILQSMATNFSGSRRSVGATSSRHAVIFPNMAANGQGLDVGGFSRLRRSVILQSMASSDSIKGFNLVRPRRSLGATSSRHAVIFPNMAANGQGFDVGGFSHLRRSVGHFAEHGYQLQRLAPVGRCHQITPCRHFAEHGYQWARV